MRRAPRFASFRTRLASALSVVLLLAIINSSAALDASLGHQPPAPSTGALPTSPPVGAKPLTAATPAGLAASPTPRPVGERPGVSPSIGVPIASLLVGSTPLGVVYDAKNGYAYVANSGDNTVSILNGTTLVATVGQAGVPQGGTYDPSTGHVDIVSKNSNSVTAWNGTIFVGSVAVGKLPLAAAYDPLDKEVYVVNSGSSNITILKGLTSVGSIALPTNSYPVAITFDPADSDLYVSDYAAGSVDLINANTVVGGLKVGSGPGFLCYDSVNQEIYVASALSNNITILHGSSYAGSIPLGYPVWGITYDDQNGYVYATNAGTGSNVTVVQGTTVLGQVATGVEPLGDAYDATNGIVYVSADASSLVTAISTVLNVQPLSASPTGSPPDSTDIGGLVTLSMSVTGNTSWSYNPVVSTNVTGFGCTGPALSISGPADTLVVGTVSVSCTPTAPGSYQVNVTLNATGRLALTSSMNFTVYPSLTVGAPTPSTWYTKGLLRSDVGEKTVWTLPFTGGSGRFSAFTWSGFPFGDCSGLTTASPTCNFSQPSAFAVSVTANDSNGATSTSPSVAFSVSAPPTVSPPIANRTTADVGQPVGFSTSAQNGSGGYVYHWTGVPANCATTLVPELTCAKVSTNGSSTNFFSVAVSVTDSNGGNSSTSPTADVVIFPDPTVLAPVPSPAEVSTGEKFYLTINVTGGPGNGNYTLTWHGTPVGACSPTDVLPTNSQVVCRTGNPGIYKVFVTCLDGDDYTITSPTTSVNVSGPFIPPGGGGTNSSPATFLGLPAVEGYAAVGLGVLVLVAIVAVVARRSRPGSRSEGEDEGPTEDTSGPTESAEDEPSNDEPLASEGASDDDSLDDLAYFEKEAK